LILSVIREGNHVKPYLFAAALALIAASAAPGQTTNCMNILFQSQNDLGNPCILAYQGGAQLLNGTQPSGACDGWAFGMPTGNGYIVIGPLDWSSRISFEYYVTNNGQLRIQYATSYQGAGTSWIDVETVSPPHNQCTLYTTPIAFPAGSVYRLSQPPGTGNPGGPLKFFLRGIQPVDPLPVELTSFHAGRVGSAVRLAWKTATETNNYGFEVERRIAGERIVDGGQSAAGEWHTVGFVAGGGTSDAPRSYTYVDHPDVVSGEVMYRLRQIDRNGSVEYSPVAAVSFGAAEGFGLRSAYPNPFNPTTTLSFTLPRDARVTLKIFNEEGREVSTSIDGEYLASGSYVRMFPAAGLPSGRYTAWLFSDSESSVMGMVLAK
jgi:hypothetical protein